MHMYDSIIDAEYSDIHHYSNQVNCTVQKIIIIYTLSHNRIAPSGRASGSAGRPCYTVYIYGVCHPAIAPIFQTSLQYE